MPPPQQQQQQQQPSTTSTTTPTTTTPPPPPHQQQMPSTIAASMQQQQQQQQQLPASILSRINPSTAAAAAAQIQSSSSSASVIAVNNEFNDNCIFRQADKRLEEQLIAQIISRTQQQQQQSQSHSSAAIAPPPPQLPPSVATAPSTSLSSSTTLSLDKELSLLLARRRLLQLQNLLENNTKSLHNIWQQADEFLNCPDDAFDILRDESRSLEAKLADRFARQYATKCTVAENLKLVQCSACYSSSSSDNSNSVECVQRLTQCIQTYPKLSSWLNVVGLSDRTIQAIIQHINNDTDDNNVVVGEEEQENGANIEHLLHLDRSVVADLVLRQAGGREDELARLLLACDRLVTLIRKHCPPEKSSFALCLEGGAATSAAAAVAAVVTKQQSTSTSSFSSITAASASDSPGDQQLSTRQTLGAGGDVAGSSTFRTASESDFDTAAATSASAAALALASTAPRYTTYMSSISTISSGSGTGSRSTQHQPPQPQQSSLAQQQALFWDSWRLCLSQPLQQQQQHQQQQQRTGSNDELLVFDTVDNNNSAPTSSTGGAAAALRVPVSAAVTASAILHRKHPDNIIISMNETPSGCSSTFSSSSSASLSSLHQQQLQSSTTGAAATYAVVSNKDSIHYVLTTAPTFVSGTTSSSSNTGTITDTVSATPPPPPPPPPIIHVPPAAGTSSLRSSFDINSSSSNSSRRGVGLPHVLKASSIGNIQIPASLTNAAAAVVRFREHDLINNNNRSATTTSSRAAVTGGNSSAVQKSRSHQEHLSADVEVSSASPNQSSTNSNSNNNNNNNTRFRLYSAGAQLSPSATLSSSSGGGQHHQQQSRTSLSALHSLKQPTASTSSASTAGGGGSGDESARSTSTIEGGGGGSTSSALHPLETYHTREIKHNIPHSFVFYCKPGATCSYCQRSFFIGQKCKHCKAKFHKDCALKASPTCGMTDELVAGIQREFFPNMSSSATVGGGSGGGSDDSAFLSAGLSNSPLLGGATASVSGGDASSSARLVSSSLRKQRHQQVHATTGGRFRGRSRGSTFQNVLSTTNTGVTGGGTGSTLSSLIGSPSSAGNIIDSSSSSCNSSAPASPAVIVTPALTTEGIRKFRFSSHDEDIVGETEAAAENEDVSYDVVETHTTSSSYFGEHHGAVGRSEGSLNKSNVAHELVDTSMSTDTNMSTESDKTITNLTDSNNRRLRSGMDTPPAAIHVEEETYEDDQNNANVDEFHNTAEDSADAQKANVSRQNSIAIRDLNIPFHQLKFKELIGVGTFGCVYRAYWHGDVAIKILNAQHPASLLQTASSTSLRVEPSSAGESNSESSQKVSTKLREEFKQELGTLRKTRHDNLVLFMGACMTPYHIIVTSFCTGQTLYKHIHGGSAARYYEGRRYHHPHPVSDSGGVLNINRAILLAAQVCQGMDYLHHRGFVHRNLKSRNIFLSDNKCIITDYGTFSLKRMLSPSHVLALTATTSSSTSSSSPTMTTSPSEQLHAQPISSYPKEWLYYLAPELCRQLPIVPPVLAVDQETDDANTNTNAITLTFSEKTDVYAFGTIWYELVSSEYPVFWQQQSTESLLMLLQANGEVSPAPQSYPAAFDQRELLELLKACWTHVQEMRPEFKDLLKSLARIPQKPLSRSPSHPVHASARSS